MKSRKAQITVFIIIGIIVLFSAAIVIYITTGKEAPEREGVVVPSEIKPVYDFVTTCMYESGLEAVQLAGLQGGYVNLENQQFISRTPSSYLRIDPGGIVKLPFWYYEGESRIPTKEYMQKEIIDYVKDRLPACLDNFSSFYPKFEVTEAGDMSVGVSFTDMDVVVRMNYPIEIDTGKGVTQHEEFLSFVPVRLDRIYNLAKKIMDAENEQAFFENLTIEFLAMSPDIPMDGLIMQCGTTVWRIEDLKETLKSILRLNLVRVKVKGTDHVPFQEKDSVYEKLAKDYPPEKFAQGIYPPEGIPTDAFEHARMYLDADAGDAKDLKVYFSYEPQWDMDMFAHPSQAGTLRSNSARGFQRFLSFMCINNYHFTYDIRLPIKAMIRDPESLDGFGYNFQFAFPVIIQENEPKRGVFRVRPFVDVFNDPSYCEQLGSGFIDAMAVGYDDEGYFMSSGIKDANISFQCLNRYCVMGQTGYNPAIPGRYVLRTAIPAACDNPFVIAEKEGYLPARQQINSDTTTVRLPLKKLKTMDFRVVKHPYFASTKEMQPAQELAEYESVSLYMMMKNGTHDQILLYPDTKEIELLDATAAYTVDAFLMRYETTAGGYSNYNLTIESGDLSGKDTMVLHVFEYRPLPTKDEKVTEMMMYLMGGTYLPGLKPTFE